MDPCLTDYTAEPPAPGFVDAELCKAGACDMACVRACGMHACAPLCMCTRMQACTCVRAPVPQPCASPPSPPTPPHPHVRVALRQAQLGGALVGQAGALHVVGGRLQREVQPAGVWTGLAGRAGGCSRVQVAEVGYAPCWMQCSLRDGAWARTARRCHAWCPTSRPERDACRGGAREPGQDCAACQHPPYQRTRVPHLRSCPRALGRWSAQSAPAPAAAGCCFLQVARGSAGSAWRGRHEELRPAGTSAGGGR